MSDKVIKARNVKMVTPPLADYFLVTGAQRGEGKVGESHAASGLRDQESMEKSMAREREEAYKRGFSEGLVFQKNQRAQALQALTGILQEVGELKKRLYAEAEEQMAGLAFKIAEKVIFEEVSKNGNVVLTVLREAVKKVANREGMKIRMNPTDLRALMEMKNDFIQELSHVNNVVFEGDGGIIQGGVVLETNSLEVDARLEKQLQEIKKALTIK